MIGFVAVFALTAATASAAHACCAAGGGDHEAHSEKAETGGTEGEHAHYEKISAALAADDLETAVAVAEKASKHAAKKDRERVSALLNDLAEAADLDAAREAFIPLSREVIFLVAGEEGYFVMNCPMVENGKWLQSDDEVKNPYMGQRMLACGGPEMETADLELAPCCEERRACCDDGGDCCPV